MIGFFLKLSSTIELLVDKEPPEDKSSDTLLYKVVSRVRDIPKLFYDWAENFCWKARKNGYLQ